MKKMILSLVLAATACTATYANSNTLDHEKTNVTLQTALQDLKQKLTSAPSGTTYGVVSSRSGSIVINTPLGRYTMERLSDGSYSFMGMKARLISAQKGIYVVKTSLGTWKLDTRRGTVTKK